jgi:hypothetical protein
MKGGCQLQAKIVVFLLEVVKTKPVTTMRINYEVMFRFILGFHSVHALLGSGQGGIHGIHFDPKVVAGMLGAGNTRPV